MKQKIFLAAGLLLMINVMGQQKPSFKFHSITNVGVLTGANNAALQLQTINGVQYKTFFGGAGVGLDNYYFRTIPLFIDLRKNFLEKRLTPFAYVDLGSTIPWDRAKVESWSTSYYRSGLFYDMGLGYSIPIKGRFGLNVSAGYSQKVSNETSETSRWMWSDYIPLTGGMPSTKDTTYYKYTLRRISLKIGFSF